MVGLHPLPSAIPRCDSLESTYGTRDDRRREAPLPNGATWLRRLFHRLQSDRNREPHRAERRQQKDRACKEPSAAVELAELERRVFRLRGVVAHLRGAADGIGREPFAGPLFTGVMNLAQP